MEPSWFVTPACCGGLFLHPAIVKVIGVMAPVIRSAASNLGGKKRIGFSTWFRCRLYGLLDHSERKDACPSPEGSKERVDGMFTPIRQVQQAYRPVPGFHPGIGGNSVPEKG